MIPYIGPEFIEALVFRNPADSWVANSEAKTRDANPVKSTGFARSADVSYNSRLGAGRLVGNYTRWLTEKFAMIRSDLSVLTASND